jgi:starch-binding outer membrane protein, SusD/RagB family
MKKILFITLTFLALFSSCDDYLNLQPIDSLVPDNFYRNASEVDKALNGVYQVLVLKGGADFLLNSEIMTDNCAYSAASGSIWLDYSRGTLNPSSVFVNKKWSDNYKGIARANLVLDNLYNRKEMVISDSTKIRLMGEAHFLRAYFYTD